MKKYDRTTEHNIPFNTRNKQRTTEHRKENQNKWERNKN